MANNSRMKLQIWASKERGRGLLLAEALGVRPPSVSDWITGKKRVPVERCTAIERATGGEVTRRDLRPDDYLEIWPELAHAQQAQSPADLIADAPLTTDPALDAALSQAEQAGLVLLPKKAHAWDGVEQRRVVDREAEHKGD